MATRDWAPDKITKVHVRKAAQQWRKDGGFLNFRNSIRYDVIIDGRPYPPKAISSIAHQFATGKVLTANDFAGAREGPWLTRLEALGFPILDKGSEAAFEAAVSKSSKLSRHARLRKIEQLVQPPPRLKVFVIRYNRSEHVVAERLAIAKGICERCGKSAPFNRQSDGSPYLQVHHKKLLSRGGLDTVENTMAVCPNCHCEIHDIARIDFQRE